MVEVCSRNRGTGRHGGGLLAVAVLVWGGLGLPVRGDRPDSRARCDPAAEVVDAHVMIDAIVDHLVDVRHEVRQWEPAKPPDGAAAQATGRTALVTLALVLCGVPSQDPRIEPAIAWLAGTPAEGTYAIAVRLMLWSRLPARFHSHATRERERLLDRLCPSPPGWDYQSPPRPHMVDHSLTQFAFQALVDASRVLEPVPDRVLDAIRAGFLRSQNADGGWPYRPRDANVASSRGSMTAAGLATVALAELASPSRGVASRRVRTSLLESMAWLDRHFTADAHPGHADHIYYWMHALERASRATGARRFGGRVWFAGFARTIRSRLLASVPGGGWRVRRGIRVENLAFALMVLRRGVEPLAFGSFDPDGVDGLPSRLGGVAVAVSRACERQVGWTRIDLRDSPEYWRRLPVVFVHGRVDSAWLVDADSIELRRIEAYLNSGGLVIALSDDRGRFASRLARRIETSWPGLRRDPFRRDHPVRRSATRWNGRAELLSSPLRTWLVAPSRVAFSRRPDRPCPTSAMLAAWCTERFGAGHGLLRRVDLEALEDDSSLEVRWIGTEGWTPIEPAAIRRLAAMLGGTSGVTSNPGPLAWIDSGDLDGLDRLGASGRPGSSPSPVIVAATTPAGAATVRDRLEAAGWEISPPPSTGSGVLAIFRAPGGSTAIILGPEILRALLTARGPAPGTITALVELIASLDRRAVDD